MIYSVLKYFFILCLSLSGLAYLMYLGNEYFDSDNVLLSQETTLKYAENDVLGRKLYSETCPRTSYLEKTELVSKVDISKNQSPSFAFKFSPKLGSEKKCPPVTIEVSRRTGEAWIINVENLP
jgi:hypothetical protein